MKNPRVFVPLLLGVLVACAIATVGQERPKDVKGWGKIKWGMTVDQAKKAYADAKTGDGKTVGLLTCYVACYVEKLAIDSLSVGDTIMQASFETSVDSDLIEAVSLHMSLGNGMDTYAHLKDSLIQKYGLPTNQEKDQISMSNGSETLIPRFSVKWIFPSTTIQLNMIGTERTAYLSVNYTAAD